MSILKINCPECDAGLKSTAGFKVGQTVCCKKCETYFVVEAPEEDELEEEEPKPKAPKKAVKAAVMADEDEDEEEEERPKKKKKRKRADDEDEEEGSYRNSPLRYVILGILVVIMLVLGFMLYQKKKREREDAKVTPPPVDTNPPAPRPIPAGGQNPFVLVEPGQPQGNPGQFPNANQRPQQKGRQGPNAGALAGGAVGDIFGGGFVPFDEAKRLTAKYTAALVGMWTADLGDGIAEQLAYTADGTYTATRTGAGATSASGKYVVQGLVGTKGLKLRLDGARTVTVIFEDDELQHPSLEKGVTAVFRRK